MTDPTTEAGRALLRTLTRELGGRTAQAAKVDILAIEAQARAAGREEERERIRAGLVAYYGESLMTLPAIAAILDAPAEADHD